MATLKSSLTESVKKTAELQAALSASPGSAAALDSMAAETANLQVLVANADKAQQKADQATQSATQAIKLAKAAKRETKGDRQAQLMAQATAAAAAAKAANIEKNLLLNQKELTKAPIAAIPSERVQIVPMATPISPQETAKVAEVFSKSLPADRKAEKIKELTARAMARRSKGISLEQAVKETVQEDLPVITKEFTKEVIPADPVVKAMEPAWVEALPEIQKTEPAVIKEFTPTPTVSGGSVGIKPQETPATSTQSPAPDPTILIRAEEKAITVPEPEPMAISTGSSWHRNPWLWGGAAFLLGVYFFRRKS